MDFNDIYIFRYFYYISLEFKINSQKIYCLYANIKNEYIVILIIILQQ